MQSLTFNTYYGFFFSKRLMEPETVHVQDQRHSPAASIGLLYMSMIGVGKSWINHLQYCHILPCCLLEAVMQATAWQGCKCKSDGPKNRPKKPRLFLLNPEGELRIRQLIIGVEMTSQENVHAPYFGDLR